MRELFAILLLTTTIAFSLSCNKEPRDILIPIDPWFIGGQAVWSPDGHTIAITWRGNPDSLANGIYLMDTADWNPIPLYVKPGELINFTSPSWSADGSWLAFAHLGQIFKIKRNGDSLTQLTTDGTQWKCDWSWSDTLIAYSRSYGDSAGLWIMKPNGSNNRLLLKYAFYPRFSLSDSVLFIVNDWWAGDSVAIVLENIPDSTFRQVKIWATGKPYSFFSYPSVSHDGRYVLLQIEQRIWSYSMSTGLGKVLTTQQSGRPAWSSDGSKILFWTPNQAGGRLWIMNADGSGQQLLPGW